MVQKFIEQGVDVNIAHAKFWAKYPLFLAICSKNEKVVEMLLKHGANPNASDNLGSTCLNRAIIQGDVKIVEILLKNKADPNILDKNGRASLHEASQGRSAEIFEMLLKERANPNIFDESGKTPLHYLLSHDSFTLEVLKRVEILLENGADANIFCKNRMSSLENWHFNFDSTLVEILILLFKHGATLFKSEEYYLSYIIDWTENEKCLELLELFLQKGANPNARDLMIGDTLLNRAISRYRYGPIRVLLDYGADPNIVDINGKTPLFRAVENGNFQLVRLLTVKGADPNKFNGICETPLHKAIVLEHLECVALLLLYGADQNVQRYDGKSSLEIALDNYNVEIIVVLLEFLLESIVDNRSETFKIILKKVIDSNLTCSRNKLLLHFVVRRQKDKIMRTLLECGVDPNAIDDDGKTALHYAVYQSDEEMIEVLVKYCNPNILDIDGYAPLHLAVDQGHIGVIEALLKNGVDPDVLDGNAELDILELIQLFVNYNCNVREKDKKGNTPLFTLFSSYDVIQYNTEIRGYQRDAIQILLKNANISEVNLNRQSILHLVIDSCLRVPLSDASVDVKDEIGIEMVEILLKSGANVDAEDIWGQSPLFIAVTHLNYDVVKLLLKYGASVSNICLNKEDFKDVKKLLPRAEISLYFLEIMDILEKEGYKNNLHNVEMVRYLIQ
ncbi:hypothetical protein TKK_0018351 [Trichogramma kaykai]